MVAKPMKVLELHYAVIQFWIENIYHETETFKLRAIISRPGHLLHIQWDEFITLGLKFASQNLLESGSKIYDFGSNQKSSQTAVDRERVDDGGREWSIITR